MADFTPTTGVVSIAYEDAMLNRGKSSREARAEFDRWLAEHDRQARDRVLDDLSASVPDDVKDWIDTYRVKQASNDRSTE